MLGLSPFKTIYVLLINVGVNHRGGNSQYEKRGLVSKETVVLRQWGSETRKFGLSTELTM